MAQDSKNSVDQTKAVLEQNITKQNAQKQHALNQEAASKLTAFKQLIEKDLGLQLKMPGSHAQKIVSTINMLAAVKKRQLEVATLIAQIMHFMKEALRAFNRAESSNSAAEYENWREHAGGETRTDQQLISERRAQMEEYRERSHLLQELREQAAALANARAECEQKLKQMVQEYDNKYKALDEKYIQHHDHLAKELSDSKTQLAETHDAQLTELAQMVTQLQTDAQKTKVALQQLDVTHVTELAQLEIPQANLTAQYEVDLAVLKEDKSEQIEMLLSNIKDPVQVEKSKADINVIREARRNAQTPAQELKARFRLIDAESSVLNPSEVVKQDKGFVALDLIDEQEERIKTTYKVKFDQLKIDRDRAEQALKELNLFQKQELKTQHKAILKNIHQCDEQRVAIIQTYEKDLHSMDQNYKSKLTNLEVDFSSEKARLEAEQATKIVAIGNELERIDTASDEVKQKAQAVTKPATEKLQVEMEQVDKKKNYKSPTMYKTDLSKG